MSHGSYEQVNEVHENTTSSKSWNLCCLNRVGFFNSVESKGVFESKLGIVMYLDYSFVELSTNALSKRSLNENM